MFLHGLGLGIEPALTVPRSATPGRTVAVPSDAIMTVRGSSPAQRGSISKRSFS